MPAEAALNATPVEAWHRTAWPRSVDLCQHLAELGISDEDTMHKVLHDGLQQGMRPARSLHAAGLLTVDNWHQMMPPAPPEPPNIPDTADAGRETGTDTPSDIDSDGPQALFFRNVDLEVAGAIDINQITRLGLLPYRRPDNRTVDVATGTQTPHSIEADEMRQALAEAFDIPPSGIRFIWCDRGQVSTCIQQTKLALVDRDEDDPETEQSAKALENYEILVKPTGTVAGNQSGEALAALLLQAIERGASDIHVFGTRSSSGGSRYQARIRVDGTLEPVSNPDGTPLELPTSVGKAIMARIVSAGTLDENQRRPRSGRFDVALPADPSKAYDLRVEITPQHGQGHLAVIRLLSTTEKPLEIEAIYPPEQSSLADGVVSVLDDMRSGGLFLVCGATGSGKTTLLAAAMSRLNDPSKHLLTIEHPIERRIDGVRQMQVEPGTGMTFVTAIESAMRLDPDIIMIGELRSPETVRTAIQAAETGHMVLSTVHVTSAAATPSRFKGLGISSGDLAHVLHGVLAQSLVATRCDRCVRVGKPSAGCGFCLGTGWRGRAAVGELMRVSPEVRHLIAEGASPAEIETASGHLPKTHHAGMLIRAGLTTVDEIADKLGRTAADEAITYAETATSDDGEGTS